MSKVKNIGCAQVFLTTGSSCGIKPSKESLETGFQVDFSNAKALLDEITHTEKELCFSNPKALK